MCGIVGFISKNQRSSGDLNAIAQSMATAIAYRGPDDGGTWGDPRVGIALGHRRLSIIDLSSAGHQPMHSPSGRYVLAYNGEIYNHLEIRAELNAQGAARHWHGHSDTETLLAGFEQWGIVATLTRTVGMFAFALWDTQTQTLHLARDRFGEKPLYFGWTANGQFKVKEGGGCAFIFGSELKALCTYPGFSNPVSRAALANYLRFMYVPAPQTIYQDIYKLEPGCMLTIHSDCLAPPSQSLRAPSQGEGFSLQRWWSLEEVVEAGSKNLILDEAEAINELELRLRESVRVQSQADVPLGAFLSGGVDSSTIVALMQEESGHPIKTFTVGFEEAAFDESLYAKAVADHLQTDHTELRLTANEAQAVIPHLAAMYDEPFADSSQIPTYLISKAARQQVTVALSGDAGDELFGGYNRYFWGPRIWNRLAKLPYPARQLLGSLIVKLPVSMWNRMGAVINPILPSINGVNRLGDKAHKLAYRLSSIRDLNDLYWSLVQEWQDPAEIMLMETNHSEINQQQFQSELFNPLNIPMPQVGIEESQLRMMYLDSMTYLPGDILCKVDRAAMAISLETRVPFLDHRVAELAWRLPLNMKIRGNEGKWALRQVLYKHVPKELIDRPKVGFGIPVGQWLRGPLRAWAENLLSEELMRKQAYFKFELVNKKWREHLSGQRDHTGAIWAILMFQSWLEHNPSNKGLG